MDRAAILDDLHRAREMEETMNLALTEVLSDYCKNTAIPANIRSEVENVASIIHRDTRRHITIVDEIVNRLHEVPPND